MGPDCVACQRDVYEFLSVHVGSVTLTIPCRNAVTDLSIWLFRTIGCCESSQSRDFSCVTIHHCGGEIIGNYVLLLDTAILRAKLELISINNAPPLRVAGG